MKSLIILIPVLLFFTDIDAQSFTVNHSNNYFPCSAISSNVKGFRITHSNSQIITPGKTVSCNNGTFHFENSYYLAYDLKNDFNLNGNWIVQNIDIAIEEALAGNSSGQSLIVKLYVMSEYNHTQIFRDSLTLLTSDTVQVLNNESGTIKNIDLSPGYTVTEGKILVVEFFLPDGIENQNLLFLGSNDDRISDSTYIRAPHCGINEPVNVSEILFPDMMLIANIYGQYASPNPEIQSFNITNQIVNTEIKNDPDYTVKVVMPADYALDTLTPTIKIPAGFQITPASGETQDFSQGQITYTVDNNFSKVSKSWQVNVVNAGPDIIDANVPEQQGDVIINGNPDYTVVIPVIEGTDISNLSPNIVLYSGFTVSPESGTVQDFLSGPVTYTVSHENLPLTQDWQVSVTEVPADMYHIKNRNVQIVPNPASNFISIKCNQFQTAEIYDINGKLLKQTSKNLINVSMLPEGFYLIKVLSGTERIYEKIIISRE